MATDDEKEKILKLYEEKANSILQKMYQVVIQAQRKAEDKMYRETLEKLERKS